MGHIGALKTVKDAAQLAPAHELCEVLPGNLGLGSLEVGGTHDLRYLLVVLLHLLEGIELLLFVCHELSSHDSERPYLLYKFAVLIL